MCLEDRTDDVPRGNVPQGQLRAERHGVGRAGSRATLGGAGVALTGRRNVRGSDKRPGREGGTGAGIVPAYQRRETPTTHTFRRIKRRSWRRLFGGTYRPGTRGTRARKPVPWGSRHLGRAGAHRGVQRALQVEGIRQIDRGVDSLPRLPTRRRSEESSLTRQPAPTKPRSISHLVRWLPPSLIPFYLGSRLSREKARAQN